MNPHAPITAEAAAARGFNKLAGPYTGNELPMLARAAAHLTAGHIEWVTVTTHYRTTEFYELWRKGGVWTEGEE